MTALLEPRSGLVGTAGHPALRRLVGMDPTAFEGHHWGTAPLLRRAEDPARFTDLISLDACDELLSVRGLRTPFVRLAKNGVVIDAARYTAGGGAGAAVADQVVPDKVAALFADGATIVLQALHRNWPPLIAFVAALAHELGHPCQVNAYLTPAGNRGFDPHYDVHDVFVLQFAGSKRWRIHAPVLTDPLPGQPWTDRRAAVAARAAEQPVLDVVLRPGDVIYLPRGTVHAAEALGGVTGHLTIGVHPLDRHALLQALVALAADDPELRRPLPLGASLEPGALAAEIGAVAGLLGRVLARADPADVAARLAATVLPQTRPLPLAPLAQAAALETLTAGTPVCWRPGLRAHLRSTADTVTVTLPDRRLELPGLCEAALHALHEGRTLRPDQLPGLDEADGVVLVRRLMREGVLVAAPGPG